MDTDKVVAYVATIGGIVVALVAAIVPVMVAIVNKRKADDDEVPPLLGMPIPADPTRDPFTLLDRQLSLAGVENSRLQTENSILRTQLADAHIGWRTTQSNLDEANRRLSDNGLPVVT